LLVSKLTQVLANQSYTVYIKNMRSYQSTYYSRIYRDFKEIEVINYRRIIHFYEKHEEEILKLDFDEYFDLIYAYGNALFEVGFHQKHLLIIDVLLELVIEYNITTYRGQDIFQSLLFRKAASHYNLRNYSKAKYVLEQLIRIAPYEEDNILFLKKCCRKDEPAILNHAKAISIFLLLLTAFIISIEVLFVRPFYKIHIDLIESSRISTFVLSCAILVVGTVWHYTRVETKVNELVLNIRKNKAKK
jgi:tetratricopeptide (TPR) repeat protein